MIDRVSRVDTLICMASQNAVVRKTDELVALRGRAVVLYSYLTWLRMFVSTKYNTCHIVVIYISATFPTSLMQTFETRIFVAMYTVCGLQ